MSGERLGRRRAGITAVTVAGVAAAGAGVVGWTLVASGASHAAANRWLLVAGTVLVAEVGFFARHLDGETPAALGTPNLVTLARGGLYAATAGFLVVPPSTPAVRWAPAACYGTGVALDFVDGYLARRVEQTTDLGARLDLAFDTLGFLVAPLVGVAWGRLPVAYLSISVARYAYRAGLAWRRRRGRPVGDLPESRVRRPLAALQMGFIAVALAPTLRSRSCTP